MAVRRCCQSVPEPDGVLALRLWQTQTWPGKWTTPLTFINIIVVVSSAAMFAVVIGAPFCMRAIVQ